MFWNRSPKKIQNHWQAEIEASMESGTSPVLDLGNTMMPSESTATLLALQTSSVQRFDVTKPAVLMGGSDPTWLSALMLPIPTNLPERAPEFTTIYAGADAATYLANRAVTINGTVTRPASQKNFTPMEPRPDFSPLSYPGYISHWESLPFLDAHDQPPATETANFSELSSDLIAWGAILAAIGLAVMAMFV